jgi:hypothetical protein
MQITTDEYMEMLADDQMKHAEAPSEDELEQMYAFAGSDSDEYMNAH